MRDAMKDAAAAAGEYGAGGGEGASGLGIAITVCAVAALAFWLLAYDVDERRRAYDRLRPIVMLVFAVLAVVGAGRFLLR